MSKQGVVPAPESSQLGPLLPSLSDLGLPERGRGHASRAAQTHGADVISPLSPRVSVSPSENEGSSQMTSKVHSGLSILFPGHIPNISLGSHIVLNSGVLRMNKTLVSTHHIFFLHPSVDGHLGCLRILPVVNKVQMSLQLRAFTSFGYITRSGIAGS